MGLPDNILVVSNSNSTIHHVYETDLDVIAAMIEAGAGTEFAIYGANGEVEALYLGTYYLNGDDLVFVPNSQIPQAFLDFDIPASSNQLPPLFWPLFILALLALPFILYPLLRRTYTVYFYGDENTRPFKQKCKKHGRLSPPDVFEREDEVILAWYKDRILTKKWSFSSDKVTKNLKLYARWVKVQ